MAPPGALGGEEKKTLPWNFVMSFASQEPQTGRNKFGKFLLMQ